MTQCRRFIPILIILALLSQSCDRNRIREAARASDRIATLVGSTIDAKRQLAVTGQITPAEELQLTQHLLVVNTRTKQFNDYVRTLTKDTAQTRLNLATAFNDVTSAVNKLSNEAIFPVKNLEAKKRLLAILNSINASIQIIDIALKG